MSAAVLPLRLDTKRLGERGQFWREFQAVLPAGIPLEDCALPAFWQPFANMLKPGDRIECTDDSFGFVLSLIVRDVTPDGVFLSSIYGKQFEDRAGARDTVPRNTTGARVRYAGPARRWVVEDAEGKELRGDIATEAEALRWLSDHVRTTSKS
jgi:hypothetical protein